MDRTTRRAAEAAYPDDDATRGLVSAALALASTIEPDDPDPLRAAMATAALRWHRQFPAEKTATFADRPTLSGLQ